jgi:uncharacterized protein (TIGR03435 family)
MSSGRIQFQPVKTFEAATVKPSRLGGDLVYATCHAADVGEVWLGGGTKRTTVSYRTPGLGRCILEGVTLKMIVGAATGLNADTPILDRGIIGGPRWTDDDRFDIEAKADDTAHVSRDDLVEMLRRLLVDRFKLKTHVELREQTGYALVVVRNGMKLEQTPPEDSSRGYISAGRPGGGQLDFQKLPITVFVNHLALTLQTKVIDQTGLTGRYSFKLSYAPSQDEFPYGVEKTPNDPTAPALNTALQEQLGLRLDSRKVSVQFTVIDAVEKPLPN